MKKEFSFLDKKLMGVMRDLLFSSETIAGIFCMCKSQKKRQKLYNFIMDNLEYVTQSDVLHMAVMIDNAREQVIYEDTIVKYIGEDDGEVVNGHLYQAGVIYDGGEVYKIRTEKRHIREYPANMFIEQRAKNIRIEFLDNPLDGEILDGLQMDELYDIVSRDNGMLTLENGCKCFKFRGSGEDFEDKPEEKIKVLEKKELLRRYILLSRFSSSMHIRPYIREDCKYVSEWSGTTIKGKQTIIDRARMVFKNCLDHEIFYHMNTGVIADTNNEELIPVGTPCMGIWEKGKLRSIVIIDVDEDGYIYKINYYSNPGLSITPDIIKSNYIEIIDGHDTGGVFWFRPCNVDLTDYKGARDYWDQVTESADEISIDDFVFDDYLAYFFLQVFDENLDANKLRYNSEEERLVSFGWNLDHNFYTREQMTAVLEMIWQLITRMENAEKEEVKKAYPVLETEYCKPLDVVAAIYDNPNYHPCAAHDFYVRFIRKINDMMEKNPEMKYFSVMGP